MTTEERHQAFTKGPNSRVVWVEAFYHEQTGQYVIYWNDILDNFGPVNNIMKGPSVLTRARDSRGNHIEPRCIKYHHDTVLNVLIGDVFSSEAEMFISTPSISRSGTPDIDRARGSVSSHTRTTTSASSRLTVDAAQPIHSAHSRPTTPTPTIPSHSPYDTYHSQRGFKDNSVEDRDDAPAPMQPSTPAFAETRLMREMNRLEKLAQEQSSIPKALGSHGQRSRSIPSWNKDAQSQRMTEAAGEQESRESIAALNNSESSSLASPLSGVSRTDAAHDVVPCQPTRRQASTQDSGTVELSDGVKSISDLPTISTSTSIADRPSSSRQMVQVMQEIQSTDQMFEQFVVKRQNEQALVTLPTASIARPMEMLSTMALEITQLQQQLESSTDQQSVNHQQQMQQLFNMVSQQNEMVQQQNEMVQQQNEMVRQQNLMLQEQAESKEREEQMLLERAEAKIREEQMLKMQQETIDRLIVNQQRVDAILVQNCELHEYPIPRLFIVLPDSLSDWDPRNVLMERFRLFFLCECGDDCGAGAGAGLGAFSDQNGSTAAASTTTIPVKNSIHLARHEGYELSCPTEFFDQYGPYVLAMLRILKHCLIVAAMTERAAALTDKGLKDDVDGVSSISERTIEAVDISIEFLESKLGTDVGDGFVTTASSGQEDNAMFESLAALEGADLRRLDTFLRNKDKDKTQGNLYRITTEAGHVKWVCLTHYHQFYRKMAMSSFLYCVLTNGGTYESQLGKVTTVLKSSTDSKDFFRRLRLVNKPPVQTLDVTLDWNTSSTDLQDLKEALERSSVSCLVLDLCNKASTMLDALTFSNRSEPIVQIMANPKIHTMTLRNTTDFLSKTKKLLKTTLHVRHFDLSETVSTAEDFAKLENLVRASPTLARLSVVVGDMDGSFDRLRPFVAQHRSLSTLDLRLQDGTTASVTFEDGLSDKICAISLKVTEPKPIRLMKMPMVTSIEFLAKYSSSKSVELVQSAIKEHKLLQEIRIVYLPDGGSEVLRDLQRAIHGYCSGWNADKRSAQDGDLDGNIDSPASLKPKDRFMELESLQKRSVLSCAELLIATTEGVDVPDNALEETTEQISGKTETVGVDSHNITSVFSLPRQDGSLAMVRYEHEQDGSHAAVLNVGDFDMSRVVQSSSVTRLMLFGERGVILFNQLIKAPATGGFTKLKTLEFDCKPGKMWGFLQVGQLARAQCPELSTLNLWNTNDTAMEKLGIPPSRTLVIYNLLLRTMDFGDYFVSQEEMLSFRKLFRGTPLLSGTTMNVSSSALSDPVFAMATRVGLEEPDMAELEGMVQPQSSGERPVMQWVMSNPADAAPVDFYAHSVYSDETSSVHFRRLAVRTESEASMIIEEDDEDEELTRRRITTINARDLSPIKE